MKYFIDFEATQYTQEIIQIGCVREDGQTFNSLIRPRKLKNVTRQITELTGLTKSQLANERVSDEVFESFFDWLVLDRSHVEFFCYGNSDLVFVKNNLNKCTNSVQAQAALSLIAANLTDVTHLVELHFRLEKVPSLKKVTEYYFPGDEHICHDALSDAEMLCAVYKAMMNETEVRGIPFPDYVGTPLFKTEKDLDRFVIVRSGNAQSDVVYKTLAKAVDFIADQARVNQRIEINPISIQKKLLGAINGKKKYFGYDWTVELRKS
jgi:DNA polymerase III epsilon subunit-like protein